MTARGPYAKGIARRGQILGVAIEIFARDGYHKTSLREVARQIGISVPTVLHYFESKDHLLTEVLQRRDTHDVDEYLDNDDAIDVLVTVMRHKQDVPGLVELYLSLAAAAVRPGHPAREFFTQHIRSVTEGLTKTIDERKKAGELSESVDSAHLARVLIALADGLQLQQGVNPTLDMAGDIQATWDLIARGSRASESLPQ